MENIEGKIAMVTGAARGLGYAYAQQLLRHGAKNVAILDLPTSNGKTAAESLEKEFGCAHGRVLFIPCDVTKVDQLRESFKKVVDTFNGLDILINNAGIFNEHDPESVVAVNLMALIRSSLIALDYMGKHKGGKGGTIVNAASIAGLSTSFLCPTYTATKFGVVGFSRSLAEKDVHKKTGVRVLTICPGVTSTVLLDNLGQRVLDIVKEETALTLKEHPQQSVDVVSSAVMDLIRKGKNGAVWVSEGGQPPYAVDFPHYSTRSVPV